MGTSYTRQASTNITNGNIIDAADLNNEFNAIEDAFDASTGHAHNGTDSAYIEETGPTGQYSFTSSAMLPDGTLDIGATGNKFQNAYFSGDVDTATVTTSGLADLNSVSINSSTTITSIDTDLSSVSASHDTLASALAIKTYIDDEVTAQDLDITDGTNTTAIDLDSETLTVTGSTGISAVVSDNTITISTTDSEILHDSLSGFVAAEHVDHSGVSITAGAGLTGGGTIEATRSIAVGAGTGIAVNADDVALSHLGLESLTDPNADRVAFWDDSAGAFKWLTMGSNLSITDTTLNATDTNTTYSTATTSTLGLVKLGSNTEQTTAANAVTTTASRTYAVQLNSSDQMVVNVPWSDTDTDTTYTAGTGVTLSGTQFSIGQAVSTSSDVTFAELTLTGDITKENPLVINTRDKATFKKETYVGDDNQYRLEIYNTDSAIVDTTEVSLNLQMKTSNGTTVGNYGRLIATPKATTTAAHDALLELQAAYNGSLVDVVSFNGGNGNLDIGSNSGDITLNAESLNNDILLRTDNTYIGKSGETINIQTDDGSQKIISTDTLTVQANTGDLDLVATGFNNIVMKNSTTTKVTFDLGDDTFTTASGYTFNVNGALLLKSSYTAFRGSSDTVDNFKIEVESDDDVRLETLKNWTDIYLFSQANDGTDRAVFWSSESQAFMPLVNDAYDLGSSIFKWDDIYATNSTIQTSDSALKQDVVAISEAETRVAQALKGLLRKYRWIASVEAKGDAARYHFGIMAQDVKQAFEDEGLNPFEYAMLTKTVEWVVTEDNGKKKSYATQEEAPEGAVETTTWGVRYTELLAFIIAGL